MTLRVRDIDGFKPASSVGIEYINTVESFSIYLHEHQICRVSVGDDSITLRITLEIFNPKLYINNIESINNIIALYQDL